MGLADLKKNSTPSELTRAAELQAQLSLDDFIDGANLYAMGLTGRKATIIDFSSRRQPQVVANTELNIGKTRHEPFRKATFTLSENAISHLAEMARNCDWAKSKLVRLLIEHHYRLTPKERHLIEAGLDID
ncbi:CopG family transcriptional regulator [Shewanella sedimentimangrovi]|uniref:CopG family transcriptional regulator n=1 Tax=Shewanella sedimentimangrovi TaxID=2814293 RepID=A0ABX7QZW8_9GAMM|nr:CopG family transcriptional regulator [Shewanella sedimentimangrovi]QSX36158.1 CopG family transcriptional regulator [Shewanella sedimentimangrovi]